MPLIRQFNNQLQSLPRLLRSNPAAAVFVVGSLTLFVAIAYFAFDVAADWHKEPLFGGRAFSEAELTSVAAAFATARLTDYDIHAGRISIPKRKRTEYIAALAKANALPARFDRYFEEFAAQSNPFESPQQRERRWQMAKQRALAHTLRSMTGIDDATVQYDEPQRIGFRDRVETTAMVALRPSTGVAIDSQLLRTVRQLVAASKSGLTPDRVTVCDWEPVDPTLETMKSWQTTHETSNIIAKNWPTKNGGIRRLPI